MNKKSIIGIIVGLLIGIYSATIPFIFRNNSELGTIIYFRGIVLGFLIISISSAVSIQQPYRTIVNGITGGLLTLIIISTLNLIFDGLIRTYWYFISVFAITFLGIFINIIRLWFYNKSMQK